MGNGDTLSATHHGARGASILTHTPTEGLARPYKKGKGEHLL